MVRVTKLTDATVMREEDEVLLQILLGESGDRPLLKTNVPEGVFLVVQNECDVCGIRVSIGGT